MNEQAVLQAITMQSANWSSVQFLRHSVLSYVIPKMEWQAPEIDMLTKNFRKMDVLLALE